MSRTEMARPVGALGLAITMFFPRPQKSRGSSTKPSRRGIWTQGTWYSWAYTG